MLQNNNTENQTKFLNLMKRKNTKQKKNCRAQSDLVYNKYFAFYKYHSTKEFAAKRSFDSKQNDLKDFENILELLDHVTIAIKPNNEGQINFFFFF